MKRSHSAFGVFLAILLVAPVNAQDVFPARPIQVIVPATAGGPVDGAMRMMEPGLSATLGGPLVILNRPGASGTVGMHALSSSEPNGYTIGMGVNSIFTVTRLSGTEVLFTLDNFTLLGNFATDVSVLAVAPDAPWKTLEDLIAFVRDNPGKLSYASAGVGTVSALSIRALMHQFGLEMTGVPFAGGAQLTVAILGRHVDMGMVPYSTGAAMLREHKLRALVTTAPNRLPSLPDTPTLAEKGIAAQGLNLIMGLYAPQGLPGDVNKALAEAVRKAATDPRVIAQLASIGLLATYEDPATARTRLDNEYKSVVALTGQLGPGR
ncbi:MAG: tripartite tricarboxylate transporter substrate binding protein [Bradyrhizobiaceae bacterium]|nr:tripartite tricarboxylate transporter substrate binding protein [Bradyrhizobiaceae bacterium]